MKKTEKMERGRLVVEGGRDDSDHSVGYPRAVKDTGLAKSLGKLNSGGYGDSKDY